MLDGVPIMNKQFCVDITTTHKEIGKHTISIWKEIVLFSYDLYFDFDRKCIIVLEKYTEGYVINIRLYM